MSTIETGKNISPVGLSNEVQTAIWDVRSWDERRGDIGFIPGSRWVGSEVDLAALLPLLSTIDPSQAIVLVCLSGRRSAEMRDTLEAACGRTFHNLEGGMLSWRAEELPTSGIALLEQTDIPKIESLEDFPKLVRSCFVAEWAMVVEDTDNFDPVEAVQEIIGDVINTQDVSLEAVFDAIDRLAELARRFGHPLDHIAFNIDRMNAAAKACLNA